MATASFDPIIKVAVGFGGLILFSASFIGLIFLSFTIWDLRCPRGFIADGGSSNGAIFLGITALSILMFWVFIIAIFLAKLTNSISNLLMVRFFLLSIISLLVTSAALVPIYLDQYCITQSGMLIQMLPWQRFQFRPWTALQGIDFECSISTSKGELPKKEYNIKLIFKGADALDVAGGTMSQFPTHRDKLILNGIPALPVHLTFNAQSDCTPPDLRTLLRRRG